MHIKNSNATDMAKCAFNFANIVEFLTKYNKSQNTINDFSHICSIKIRIRL